MFDRDSWEQNRVPLIRSTTFKAIKKKPNKQNNYILFLKAKVLLKVPVLIHNLIPQPFILIMLIWRQDVMEMTINQSEDANQISYSQ